jgi:hypothetical protein
MYPELRGASMEHIAQVIRAFVARSYATAVV